MTGRAKLGSVLSIRRNGPAAERSPQRAYWEAFAWWRRGMNGFWQEPRPTDVLADFEHGARAARAALALDPAFDEARSALAGCLMGQAFAGAPDEREAMAALVREALGLVGELEGRASDNPRSLWMVGGRLLGPPAQGGDLALAEATFLRGLEAARGEALGPARPAWMPTWGAPENLMSLAFLHTLGPHPRLAVARAYAEGALAMVPGWRYVRDQLLPRIARLEADAPPPATSR